MIIILYYIYLWLGNVFKEANIDIKTLAVDGGATENKFLMQFQSDLLKIPVIKPKMSELTSLGAAYLAGIKAGFWENTDTLTSLRQEADIFKPLMKDQERQNLLAGWKKALEKTLY